MIKKKSQSDIEKEEAKRKIFVQKKYLQRITIAKQGREAFTQKDYMAAAQKYHEYLGILSEINEIEEGIYSLSPTMFDAKKDVTEMLLISHVYWEIARINEMTPKLQSNFQKSLNQFVKFTINQPYQVLNAEMLRKYINKHKKTSKQILLLNEAYQQIFVQSSKCFIATMCYGETHSNTLIFRKFKLLLNKSPIGLKLIEIYYRYSPFLVELCQRNHSLRRLTLSLVKPPLSLLAKALRYSILK